MIYLAEPIDQVRIPEPAVIYVEWAATVGGLQANFNTYRPSTAWVCGGGLDPRVQQINLEALANCDLLVAFLPAGVPSIGVPMEIQAASAGGIPVVVLTQVASMALAGAHGVSVVDSVEAVFAAIDRLSLLERDIHQLKVTLREGGQLPTRAHTDDAGIDLYTAETTIVEPGHFIDVPTDVTGVQLPPWAWGMITGRSSTLRKLGLHVPIAVIDPGWRGPLYVGTWNLGTEPVKVEQGSRLGQLVVLQNSTANVGIYQVDRLDPHHRGLAGFGSTGQ